MSSKQFNQTSSPSSLHWLAIDLPPMLHKIVCKGLSYNSRRKRWVEEQGYGYAVRSTRLIRLIQGNIRASSYLLSCFRSRVMYGQCADRYLHDHWTRVYEKTLLRLDDAVRLFGRSIILKYSTCICCMSNAGCTSIVCSCRMSCAYIPQMDCGNLFTSSHDVWS